MPPPLASKHTGTNLIRAFKAHGCDDCGVRYPDADWSILHIAHLSKDDRTPLRWKLERTPIETILAELLKCRCLCAKCHAKEHANGNGLTDGQLPLFNGSGVAWHP